MIVSSTTQKSKKARKQKFIYIKYLLFFCFFVLLFFHENEEEGKPMLWSALFCFVLLGGDLLFRLRNLLGLFRLRHLDVGGAREELPKSVGQALNGSAIDRRDQTAAPTLRFSQCGDGLAHGENEFRIAVEVAHRLLLRDGDLGYWLLDFRAVLEGLLRDRAVFELTVRIPVLTQEGRIEYRLSVGVHNQANQPERRPCEAIFVAAPLGAVLLFLLRAIRQTVRAAESTLRNPIFDRRLPLALLC